MSRFLVFIFFICTAALQAQSGDLAARLETHTHILASDSLEGRGLGTEGKDRATRYIIQQFEETGLEPLYPSYRHEFLFRSGLAWIPATNLIGIIPGSDPALRDEYIVIGAHYDHLGYTIRNKEKEIFPGADDNASGVASIIELARSLVKDRSQLKRSVIIVAFDAEESGLYGAERFLEDSVVSVEKIKFMFSLDMVGMYQAHGGLDLKGIESVMKGGDLAESVADRLGVTLKKKGKQIEQRTDTAPFGNVGIPAAHAFTGLKSPYHKPGDKSNLLDYSGMALVNTFLHELTTELANSEELIPNLEITASSEAGKQGYKVFEYGITMSHGSGHHRYPDLKTRTFAAYNFGVGFMAQVRVHRMVTFQPEILFDLNNANRSDGRFRRQSITTPLNIQLGTPVLGDSGFRVYGLAGPYYRYHLSIRDGQGKQPIGEAYPSSEWGYNLGFGIDLAQFQLTWTFRRGLTNILNSEDTVLYDRNSLLTLGYKF